MRVVLEKGREAAPVKSEGSVLRFKEEKETGLSMAVLRTRATGS